MTADRDDNTTPQSSSSTAYGQMSHVARGGAISLLGAAVSAVAGFLMVVVVTNWFETDVAGVLFTATSVFLVLTAFATLGSGAGLARFMLRYETLRRYRDIQHCLSTAFIWVSVFASAITVALLVLAGPIARAIGLDQPAGPTVLRILALALPAATLMQLALAGTRAFGRMRTTVFVDQFLRSVGQPVLIMMVGLAGGGLVYLTAAWAVPYVVGGALALILFYRFVRRRMTRHHDDPDESRGAAFVRREFWSFTWPRAFSRVSQMAIQRADIILVAALRSPAEAAIYTAATRFVVVGQFGTRAIQQVLQPRFTRLLVREEREVLDTVYKLSTAWSMTTSWPLYLLVGCAPGIYLSVFGEGYHEAGPVVVVMMVSMLIAVFSGSVDTLLVMEGRSSQSLVNATIALAVDLGLCILLIPSMGILGAAFAWGAAITTRCTLACIQVRNSLRVTPFGKATTIAACASLVAFALPLVTVSALSGISLKTYAFTALFGVAVYAGLLWLAREPLMLSAVREILRTRPSQAAKS